MEPTKKSKIADITIDIRDALGIYIYALIWLHTMSIGISNSIPIYLYIHTDT